MEIRNDRVRLLTLIEKAQKGDIALPQFQRNFVWSREDISDLLLSIMKGYYIGSFLFLQVDRDNNPFGIRPLAGVEILEKQMNPDILVLDGQQRLTSILYAISAPNIPVKWAKYPYRFFIHLNKMIDGNEDQFIFSERYDFCKEYYDQCEQFKSCILPLKGIPSWNRWLLDYGDYLYKSDKGKYELFVGGIRDKWDSYVKTFTDFQVPVLEIPKIAEGDQNGIADVCAIFEKLNSTGVTLSVFDLLTARLYKYGIDLHALWKEVVEKHKLLEKFSAGEPDTYGIFILRVIALVRGKEVRTKVLINLDQHGFRNDWIEAALAIEQALNRIISTESDGFGAFEQKWQPYSTLVPVLAVLLNKAKDATNRDRLYKDIKCWYWGSVFSERYSSSIETLTYRDSIDLLRRFEDAAFIPQAFIDIRRSILENSGFTLMDVSRVNSVYRGIMNLIAINGAKDFEANDNITFHDLDDHHIFPKFHLETEHRIKGDEANTILNKTLITQKTNRRISKKSPKVYLPEVIPNEERETILRSHLIGAEAQRAMENDDYNAFLTSREKDLLNILKGHLQPAQ